MLTASREKNKYEIRIIPLLNKHDKINAKNIRIIELTNLLLVEKITIFKDKIGKAIQFIELMLNPYRHSHFANCFKRKK